MTKTRSTKRALLMSGLVLLLCLSVLVGSTFAWFTDSVTSSGNIIHSGTLDVSMKWRDATQTTDYVDASSGAMFTNELWEPGYVDAKNIVIKNEGTLALKYQLNIIASGEVSALSDVIDVYYAEGEFTLADRDMTELTRLGTLTEVLAAISETASGDLTAGESDVVTLALKMQETAGNEYQDLSIGTEFAVQLVATQLMYENDSFDNKYDESAPLDFVSVSTASEFEAAVENKAENIVMTNNIILEKEIVVDYNANIDGAGYSLVRTDGISLLADEDTPAIYTGAGILVKSGNTLELTNIVVDGGALWTGEVNPVLQRGTVNAGVTATGALVTTEANATLILGEGAVLQNNDGANAVFLTKVSKLIINGGEIINNHSAAGAIWGAGEIVLNSGKISYNHGGLGGAIRAVTNVGAILTMNGGEMNHNYSDSNGGAIWAGTSRSNNVYVLNGGEMAYNYSASTGGAIYAGYYETVKIGGTFKMHDNDCSANIGAAIRFHTYASFVMTGGEIYNNGDDGNSLYLNNNSASITGGKITDNFGYSGGLGLTWGEAEVDGVIAYNLATNHNTAYLAKEFGTLKFTVNEGDANFAKFNFKPATDYVYTEGDEAKLICMNEGYETYWDAATSTFRLQAI